MSGPLNGVRVLALEQAAALSFATRHLAHLGAEVIRVQSHARGPGVINEADLTAGKLQLGLDLAAPGGPDVFRQAAAHCDVVAHNFTPRVVRKYGIDYPGIKAVRPDVVYLSLTGYGTTGPWGERPLFGPGAEAASGHNWLIGWSGDRPGRPGTITYADNVCGLYAAFAVLAALEERDRTGQGAHIDISLYETAVSHLGPVLAEAALGARPAPVGNADANFAWHGAFPSRQPERHVVVAATADQLAMAATALGALGPDPGALEAALAQLDAAGAVEALQAAGIPAAVAADVADLATDPHLWSRGWFAPWPWTAAAGAYRGAVGPAWGRSLRVDALSEGNATHGPGQHNADVLGRVAGLRAADIDALIESGTVGVPEAQLLPTPARPEVRVERGELARVDHDHFGRVAEAVSAAPRRGARAADARSRARRARADRADGADRQEPTREDRPVAVEVSGGVGVAYAAKLLAGAGWDVVRYEPAGGGDRDRLQSRWGGAKGAAYAFLDQGKRRAGRTGLAELVSSAQVVVGDFSPAGRALTGLEADAFLELAPEWAVVSISAFGLEGPRSDWAASDTVVQAACGLMYLTGEYSDPPTQLAPYQAALAGGVAGAGAVLAAARQSRTGGGVQRLDVAMVEALAALTYPALSAYGREGHVPRREARVPAGLRMVETADGWLYCAPGAVAQMRMDGMAQLLEEPRLNEDRFQTAAGRMGHWEEFLAVFVPAFQRRTAAEWFERASEQHMTLALVQRVEDLTACPQLRARGLLQAVPGPGGTTITVPGRPYRKEN